MMLSPENKMDSNFENAVKSLEHDVEEITDSFTDVQVDTLQLELDLRKQELELVTKRKHVSQLREENDEDKQIIHDLKTKLNQANARAADLERENCILKQNWNELNLNHTSFVEGKLRCSILEQENTTLKDVARKCESEKRILQRKIDDSLLQEAIHEENIKKLLEEDKNIRATVNKHVGTFNDMVAQKGKMLELHSKSKELQKRMEEFHSLKNKLEVSENRADQLEEAYTFARAKLEMLEELLQNYSLPRTTQDSDLHKYFEEKANDLERQLETERELVLKQNERLNKEINANVYLCRKIGELEKKLEDAEGIPSRYTGKVENAI